MFFIMKYKFYYEIFYCHICEENDIFNITQNIDEIFKQVINI